MESFRQVSEQEFFNHMGPKDVTPYPKGAWPYVSYWKARYGAVVGISEGYLPEGRATPETRYWLPA